MRMLLINQNPIVSKLVGLSAQKAGDEINEELSVEEVEGSGYDVLFIDDAKLEGLGASELKSRLGVRKICLIYADDEGRIDGFDYYIKKPFLPTEMVDLMSEIKDDLTLPEMDGAEETPETETPAEEKSEEDEQSLETAEEGEEAEESLLAEDFDALLEELEQESESQGEKEESAVEEAGEEDFDALMASLEAGEEPQAKDGEEDAELPEEETGLEQALGEPEREETAETSETGEEELPDLEDLDALLEEVETAASTESEEGSGEDFDALLEGLDLEELEVETTDEEPVSLPEPAEEVGGVLDESLVSEVKELLDEDSLPSASDELSEEMISPEESEETAPEEPEADTQPPVSPDNPEEEAVESAETAEEGVSEPAEDLEEFEALDLALETEAESFGDTMSEEHEETSETSQEPAEKMEEEAAIFEEFDALSEAELGAVLGEEFSEEITEGRLSEPSETEENSDEAETVRENVGTPSETPQEKEHALISTLLGMDPEALRKLLAGAQINISITFPKEV